MKNWFRNLFVLELVVIASVISIFKIVSERLAAGALAGTLFVALGLWIFIGGLKQRELRRSFTFPVGCIHLFVVALPMMITRLLNQTLAFEEVRILGLPGPIFHQLSTAVYFLMLLATIADYWRARPAAGSGVALPK